MRADGAAPRHGRLRVSTWWYAIMAAGGVGFGLVGERRPFGDGFFAQPLVAFFILVGVALVAVRIVRARPVPEVIPERALLIGCFIGLAAFLTGNFVGVHVLAAIDERNRHAFHDRERLGRRCRSSISL